MANLLKVFSVLLILVTITAAAGTGDSRKQPLPKDGVIPDAATAVKIAEAIFTPIFGTETVAKYQPYTAQLKDEVWTVYGTLKPGARGGTPQLTIQKTDGKVIEVWFSQ